MMNWIDNWYHPEREVAVAELARNMSQLLLFGYLNGLAADAAPQPAGSGTSSQSIWKTKR